MAAVVLVVGLVVAGLVLVVAGLAAPTSPPPTPVASSPPGPVASVGPVEPVRPVDQSRQATGPAPLVASAPKDITIPSIDVTSPVNAVGLNADRTLEVPAPGPLYDQAAWYRGSVTPGELGPSVIIGHVDSAKNGPSVFYRLGALRPGAAFTVTRADGAVLTFRVDSVRTYTKNAFPTQTVYGGTTRPEIRLITCGGPFDSTAGSYRNNTIVFAHLIT